MQQVSGFLNRNMFNLAGVNVSTLDVLLLVVLGYLLFVKR
jgi:hypothetical protein